MGSMSSAVFVGSFHQNDGDLIPTHLVQIFEGNSLSFVVTALEGPEFRQTWQLVDPEAAFETLLAAIALTIPDHGDHPMVNLRTIDASRLPDSAITELVDAFRTSRPGIVVTLGARSVLRTEQFVNETSLEVQVLTPFMERTFSAWQNEMITTHFHQSDPEAK